MEKIDREQKDDKSLKKCDALNNLKTRALWMHDYGKAVLETSRVFVAFECHNDYCNIHKYIVQIFRNKEDAVNWVKSGDVTPTEWREYQEFEVS